MKSTNLIAISLLLSIPSAHAVKKAKAQTMDRCSHFTVISHRGLAGLFPEESNVGYMASADIHTDYLEMDVHRTKDNILIVNHDSTFERTTDIATVFPKRVNDPILTFTWDEISKLKNKGVPILRLEDVINISLTHPNHPGLYIESKSPDLYPGYEKQIVDLLEKMNAFKQVKIYFQSFDSDSLAKFKALRPEIPRVYLTEAPYDNLSSELKIAAIVANGIGPDLNQVTSNKMDGFLKRAHQAKLVVHFWTVDSAEQMDQLIKAKADGVFTNRTDVVIETCGRMSKADVGAKIQAYQH
jgi:glycerophosphoryl diester phosphodiesterase